MKVKIGELIAGVRLVTRGTLEGHGWDSFIPELTHLLCSTVDSGQRRHHYLRDIAGLNRVYLQREGVPAFKGCIGQGSNDYRNTMLNATTARVSSDRYILLKRSSCPR